MNEEPLEHFKELCAVWIDHLNQTISFHPADGFEHPRGADALCAGKMQRWIQDPINMEAFV